MKRYPLRQLPATAIGGLVWFAVAAGLAVAAGPDDVWPRFRGADGNGLSAARTLPVQWTDADLRWKATLPGKGHSSPVVWGNRLFVTSGDEATADRYIICLATADGKKLWEKRYPSQTYQQNRDNSYGTATPAIDAGGVYVCWTTPDAVTVVALGHDGAEKWRRELGSFKARHGSGASPVVAGQAVWIANDQEGPSSLVALDTASGAVRFRIERRTDKAVYGTPCLLQQADRPDELVFASSSHGLTSVNPVTGAVNWECPGLFAARIVSSPISSDGLVLCSSGEGGTGRRLVAVRPPAAGATATVAYDLKSGVPNVPTPLARDGRLFLLCDNGLLRCVRTATGELIWEQRLGEPFYGSPVWAQDRLYVASRRGTVFVIAAADQYQLLARNELGAVSHATPAIAGETIFFRTVSHLVAVGGRH
jgi:outer membrane protein assembly factor BamB